MRVERDRGPTFIGRKISQKTGLQVSDDTAFISSRNHSIICCKLEEDITISCPCLGDSQTNLALNMQIWKQTYALISAQRRSFGMGETINGERKKQPVMLKSKLKSI